jgi:hypothetical protein
MLSVLRKQTAEYPAALAMRSKEQIKPIVLAKRREAIDSFRERVSRKFATE